VDDIWPYFVVLAILAALVGALGWTRGPRRFAILTTLAATGATLASCYIVGAIMFAAGSAGGLVNPG